jgi:L-asparaginase
VGRLIKFYNQSNGELEFDKTHFPEMIKRSRIEVNIIPEELNPD